jgi:hypothetical protein
MYAACGLLLLTGFYPLWRAWRANRDTTIRPAVAWAAGAWAAWCAAAWAAAASPGDPPRLWWYAPLCLTGCASVAVFGARRPVVGAWNFVVAGLLAVLLLPVAEGLGNPRPTEAEAIFLAATLTVGLLNYLPTPMGIALLPVGIACVVEMASFAGWADLRRWEPAGLVLLAVAPWAGLGLARRSPPERSEFDRLWLDFRDRFGAVWALPAREQFNRAAANAGWPVALDWRGLRLTGQGPPDLAAPLAALRALLKRFGPDKETPQ